MKLGTTITFGNDTLGLKEGEVYQFLSKLGFDCIDYGLPGPVSAPVWQLSDEELKERMLHERELIKDGGMMVSQTHSPFDYNLGCSWMDPVKREQFWRVQIQSIKATAYLGAPYMVVHALAIPGRRGGIDGVEHYETAKKYNIEFFRFLEPYLKEYDVKIAIENLFTSDHVLDRMGACNCSKAEDIIDYIDTLDSDRFVACLDTGHAMLCSQDPVDMIYKFGKKYLHVLHVHDNLTINDDHMFPGGGRCDWYRLGKALNDIGYEGVFSYEIGNPYGVKFPELAPDMIPVLHKMYVELGKAITNVK